MRRLLLFPLSLLVFTAFTAFALVQDHPTSRRRYAELNQAFELFNAGVQRELTSDGDGAIEQYNRAVEKDPRMAAAYYRLGRLLLEKDDLDRADANLRRALAIGHLDLGILQAKKKDFDAAIVQFSTAISLDGTLGEAFFQRGLAKGEKNSTDLKAAVDDWNEAIRLGERDTRALSSYLPETYFYRGMARMFMNMPLPAFNDLSNAIRARNNYVEAYKALPILYRQSQNKLLAEKTLRDNLPAIARAAPQEREILLSLGDAYIIVKNYPEAERLLQTALRANDRGGAELARVYEMLGVLYASRGSQGDCAEAREQFKLALDSAFEEPELKREIEERMATFLGPGKKCSK